MRKSTVILFICSFLLNIAAALNIATRRTPATPQPIETIRVERDTVYHTDTVLQTITKPQYIDRTVIKTDTLKADTVIRFERLTYHIPIDNDSVTGEINATISGHDVALDTLDYRFIIPTRTITNTIDRTITKRRHFNYGIGVGFGYGVINRKPDVFIGITASCTF